MALEKKYMTYTSVQLKKAVDRARRGTSVRQAARCYGIPEATLRRQMKQQHPRSPGKPTVLTAEEERIIIDWIVFSAKAGFPVDAQRLRSAVAHFLRKSGRPSPFTRGIPGRKWLQLFLKRHPDISRRAPSALSKQRTAVSEKPIRNWFREIGEFLQNEGLDHILQKPECVFNMDESAVRLVPTKEQVFAKTGEKYVHTRNGNSEKESYTALFAANAAGTLAPPLILFPYKQRMPAEIAQNAPPDWAIGRNKSAWMNQETFHDYFEKVFVPWLKKSEITLPVIVFVDGHSSHVSLQTVEFCRANQITLVSLYPNATHVLQPLDVSFFRPLKVHWNKRLIEYRTFHAGEHLPKHEIAPLMKRAVDDMQNLQSTIQNGFRKCGIVPWDPDAVNYAMLLQDHPSGETDAPIQTEENGQTATDESVFLRVLESRLKVGQLKLFERHQHDPIWPGPASDTNLFYIWQEAKKAVNSPNRTAGVPGNGFRGFGHREVEGDRNRVLSLWDKFEELPGEPTNTGHLGECLEMQSGVQQEPSTSNTPTQLALSEVKENLLDEAFSIPRVTPKTSKAQKRPRAPAVATSDEFRAWYAAMEAEKQKKEELLEEKRSVRAAKKAAALKRRQEKQYKPGFKKPKLVI